MTEHFATLTINQQNIGHEEYILTDEKGHVYVPYEEIQQWGITLPDVVPLTLGPFNFYNLSSLGALEYTFDPTNEKLMITLPANLFQSQTYQKNEIQFNALRPQQPGAYLNYDLSAQIIPESNTHLFGALTGINYFNYFGVGQADFLLQNNPNYEHMVRLESSWTLDKPENMATWRFGDSITGTNIWTGAVRFGGIQYASNFATQPGFVTYPLPSFKGDAIVPTSVNFYLDEQLRMSQNVNAGPFAIEGLPAVTGAGDLVVQSKDLLGRQTAVVIPYYVAPELLRRGLSDFSYEVGAIRRNYGIASNDYSELAAVGGLRKGITDRFTLGWHGELLKKQQTLGIGGNYLINQIGLLSFAGALSHSDSGPGGLMLLGASRQSQVVSVGIQAIATTHDFLQIGIAENQLSPSLIGQFFASYTTPRFGTLSFIYSQRNGRSEQNIGAANLTYSKNIFKNFFFLVNVVTDVFKNADTQLLVSLVWSPASSYTASSSIIRQDNSLAPALAFSKTLPVGNGYGYRLLAQTDGDHNSRYNADYSYQNDYGTYLARYSRYNSTNNYEFDAAGSVVMFAHDTFLARYIDRSFAVVEIPNVSGVKVYESNQLIGKTNNKGHILIPDTRPFERNQVSIDIRDVPFNYQIATTEIDVYPYFRSGVLVSFPIKPVRNISFTLVDPNDKLLAPGTALTIRGYSEPAIVGYNGNVFLNIQTVNTRFYGVTTERHPNCTFVLEIPPSNEIIIDLGKVTCVNQQNN